MKRGSRISQLCNSTVRESRCPSLWLSVEKMVSAAFGASENEHFVLPVWLQCYFLNTQTCISWINCIFFFSCRCGWKISLQMSRFVNRPRRSPKHRYFFTYLQRFIGWACFHLLVDSNLVSFFLSPLLSFLLPSSLSLTHTFSLSFSAVFPSTLPVISPSSGRLLRCSASASADWQYEGNQASSSPPPPRFGTLCAIIVLVN